MNYETLDILYRSRLTLLDHLESEGYVTQPYRKFSHKELHEMIKAGPANGAPPALMMNLQRRTPVEGQPTECVVVYTIGRIKQKIATFTKSIMMENEEDESYKTKEFIVMTLEPIAPTFHSVSYDMWKQFGVRVRYFQVAAIVNNPLKHILVPPHEKVPAEEEEELLKRLFAKKSQLPIIRYHEDPIARMLGLVPGDIVKITRPSPTAGEYITYRLCWP
jgi:DNA-directed RNA polymerase subunit H (RpoH/RPB5)